MDRAAASGSLPNWQYPHRHIQQATSHPPTILHHITSSDHRILAQSLQSHPSTVCQELAAAAASLRAALWHFASPGMALLSSLNEDHAVADWILSGLLAS